MDDQTSFVINKGEVRSQLLHSLDLIRERHTLSAMTLGELLIDASERPDGLQIINLAAEWRKYSLHNLILTAVLDAMVATN